MDLEQKRWLHLQISKLVGLPLLYAFRYNSTELFCFGFGSFKKIYDECCKTEENAPTYALHVQCVFDIGYHSNTGKVIHISEATDSTIFYEIIQTLCGCIVQRVEVMEENCALRIEFNKFWIMIQPNTDEDESWRFFEPYSENGHIVVSNKGLVYN